MKNTPLILAIILAVLFPLAASAQLNHVLNGSFEQHRKCPDNFDQVKYANYWNGIDTSWVTDSIMSTIPPCLPEYENTCGVPGFRLPSTPWFYQYPHTGNALIQSVIYYNYGYAGLDQYNYLQGRLNNHLTAGKSYCVTFFVNRAHATGYSINKIGAYLDDGSIDTTRHCGLPQTQYTPQVLDTSIISDTLSWTRIQGSFIASGTERFITIGDFFDTGNVVKATTGSGTDFGLYLIDDVSVIASDAIAYAGADTFVRQGDTAQVGAIKNGDGMPCWWYIMGNTAPIDSGGTIKVHPSVTTTYVVKMDLCGTITYDTVKVWVWPSSVSNQQPAIRNCRVYPNPSAGALTIQNASGCEVVLYDVLGREALRPGQLSSGPADAIDISALPKGVYLLKVTDTITGENLTLRLLKE